MDTSATAQFGTLLERNARVLIVDDNPAIHEDFQKTLRGNAQSRDALAALDQELFGGEAAVSGDCFDIMSAHQGEEAIRMVRDARAAGRPFALAFVDVRMPPGLDGIETTARILDADSEIGIVICSAYSDHSWEEMAERLGKTDRVLILKKPFDTIEVRQLAHSLRRRWELARLVALRVEDLKAMVEARTGELAAANEALKLEGARREKALEELAESNEQVRTLAYQDGLTGLPNRRLLNEHLEKVLARSRRKGTEFALLFVDLDNFKLINDTIGHQGADRVLQDFAGTLTSLIRDEDVVGLYMDQNVDPGTTITTMPVTESVLSRLGGDEFVILLPEIKDRFAAGAVAHRVLQRLERPFEIAGNEVFLTTSIGIATYPEDGETAEALLRNADTAMYHAKQGGKEGYQYYSAEMNAASVERLALESRMRRALDEDRFEIHFQPQIDISTGRICGAEALLRWHDTERGYVPPATFIPVAEDSSLILQLGKWVLERACYQAVEWQRTGLPAIPVAVNVSAVQFRRQDICELTRRALAISGLAPEMLWLEITESSLMSSADRAQEVLDELRDLGVRIALDDFGTGFSSLSYLKSLPLDMVKIDRSFIAEILADARTASITEAIITLTESLGFTALAEGVETAAQLEALKRLGCEQAQGFLFSEALPPGEFAALVAASVSRGGDAGQPAPPRRAADG